MRTAGIIPARYASTRLPGKPLLEIEGRPMIWWVYQRAAQADRLDELCVAADDERIMDACRRFGIPAVMTADTHRCAAERLAEASDQIRADFYVQINGDEPLIFPDNINAAVPDQVPEEEEYGTNIITGMKDPAEVLDPSNIKVVFDEAFRALYMSRSPVPCPFLSIDFPYYKHVGIIGYNKPMLNFYMHSEPGRFEKIEGIDTLRFLDYGKYLQFIRVEKTESLSVDTAKEYFLNCFTLNLNRQKGLLSIDQNHGNAKNRNIFMDTYIMKKELFIELVHKAKKTSSMYTLADIVNASCDELDIRGVSHRGYFASITDFKSYYDANISLIDFKTAQNLFDDEWPIYTRTNDSCPTQYFDTADVKNSVVSNGCLIEGTIENSIIGRGCVIKKGAVIKNSVILPAATISEDVHIENHVVDKHAKVIHAKDLTADPEKPGYIRRGDTL